MATLIKKAHHGEFRQVLAALRLATLDSRSFVAIPKKKLAYGSILGVLLRSGFIEGFEERGETVIINLKQSYWKSFQYPMHAFTAIAAVRLNKNGTVSATQLSKAQQRHGYTVEFVLSTDDGVASGSTAIAKKTGGIPLLKIY